MPHQGAQRIRNLPATRFDHRHRAIADLRQAFEHIQRRADRRHHRAGILRQHPCGFLQIVPDQLRGLAHVLHQDADRIGQLPAARLHHRHGRIRRIRQLRQRVHRLADQIHHRRRILRKDRRDPAQVPGLGRCLRQLLHDQANSLRDPADRRRNVVNHPLPGILADRRYPLDDRLHVPENLRQRITHRLCAAHVWGVQHIVSQLRVFVHHLSYNRAEVLQNPHDPRRRPEPPQRTHTGDDPGHVLHDRLQGVRDRLGRLDRLGRDHAVRQVFQRTHDRRYMLAQRRQRRPRAPLDPQRQARHQHETDLLKHRGRRLDAQDALHPAGQRRSNRPRGIHHLVPHRRNAIDEALENALSDLIQIDALQKSNDLIPCARDRCVYLSNRLARICHQRLEPGRNILHRRGHRVTDAQKVVVPRELHRNDRSHDRGDHQRNRPDRRHHRRDCRANDRADPRKSRPDRSHRGHHARDRGDHRPDRRHNAGKHQDTALHRGRQRSEFLHQPGHESDHLLEHRHQLIDRVEQRHAQRDRRFCHLVFQDRELLRIVVRRLRGAHHRRLAAGDRRKQALNLETTLPDRGRHVRPGPRAERLDRQRIRIRGGSRRLDRRDQVLQALFRLDARLGHLPQRDAQAAQHQLRIHALLLELADQRGALLEIEAHLAQGGAELHQFAREAVHLDPRRLVCAQQRIQRRHLVRYRDAPVAEHARRIRDLGRQVPARDPGQLDLRHRQFLQPLPGLARARVQLSDRLPGRRHIRRNCRKHGPRILSQPGELVARRPGRGPDRIQRLVELAAHAECRRPGRHDRNLQPRRQPRADLAKLRPDIAQPRFDLRPGLLDVLIQLVQRRPDRDIRGPQLRFSHPPPHL